MPDRVLAGLHGAGEPSRQARIFVSHGIRDAMLPIENTSRRIVRQLKKWDYEVHYREFDGPHTVPPEIAREALAWFAK